MPTKGKEAVVTEKLVVELWKRQALLKPLRTAAGQDIEVIYSGRHCCDRGPDFRGAIMTFDGDLRRGDVEIHVRASDWRGHGHHVDAAYDGVILHVVMWQTADALTQKSSGEAVPVLGVERHLAVSVDELPTLLTVAPYTPFRCAAGGDVGRVLTLLDLAGERRLQDKAASMEGTLAVLDPEEALYRAIMAALGYTRNTAGFVQLAEIVPFFLLRAIAQGETAVGRSVALQSFLLGKAGLLPWQRRRRDAGEPNGLPRYIGYCNYRGLPLPTSADELLSHRYQSHRYQYEAYVQTKWEDLATLDDGCRVTVPWHFGRVRPHNYPPLRLAAAGQLFSSLAEPGLCESLLGPLRVGEPEAAHRAMEEMLMVKAADGYWHCHCDFGKRLPAMLGDRASSPSQVGAHLIGRARAAEIVVNAILPFAVAYGQMTGDRELSRRAMAAFRGYPFSAENEIGRYMAGLILDPKASPSLRTASRQQGLLYLYRAWCVDKRCSDCPLGRTGPY